MRNRKSSKETVRKTKRLTAERLEDRRLLTTGLDRAQGARKRSASAFSVRSCVTGTYQPLQPLSLFNGQAVDGRWDLKVYARGVTGVNATQYSYTFERELVSGQWALKGSLRFSDATERSQSLTQASRGEITPDGEYLVVTSEYWQSLLIYRRDIEAGGLTFLQSLDQDRYGFESFGSPVDFTPIGSSSLVVATADGLI